MTKVGRLLVLVENPRLKTPETRMLLFFSFTKGERECSYPIPTKQNPQPCTPSELNDKLSASQRLCGGFCCWFSLVAAIYVQLTGVSGDLKEVPAQVFDGNRAVRRQFLIKLALSETDAGTGSNLTLELLDFV